MKTFRLGMVTLLIYSLFITACSSTENNQQLQVENDEQTENNDVSDLNWRVPNFQAVNQEGQKVTLQDLKGKIWLADFIFTRCPNICPPMTANLSRVQKELAKQKVEVQIISFSVDPVYDQPEILKAFAQKHQADLSNWSFLTGYKLQDVQNIAQTAFKGTVTQQKGPSAEVPILVNHPSQLYLVDQNGKVRKFYNALQPDSKKITQDIKKLSS